MVNLWCVMCCVLCVWRACYVLTCSSLSVVGSFPYPGLFLLFTQRTLLVPNRYRCPNRYPNRYPGLRVFMRIVDRRCPQALRHPREALQVHSGRCCAHRRRYHAHVQRQVHWTSRRVGAAPRDPVFGKEREMRSPRPPRCVAQDSGAIGMVISASVCCLCTFCKNRREWKEDYSLVTG